MTKIEINGSSVSNLINNLYGPKYKFLGELNGFSDGFPMDYRLNKINLYLLSIRIRGIP